VMWSGVMLLQGMKNPFWDLNGHGSLHIWLTQWSMNS